MIKIDEHLEKMKKIKYAIEKTKGKQKLQYLKNYHKLEKELKLCYIYLYGKDKER